MEHAAKNFEPSLNVLITRNIVHKQIRKVRIEETEVLATAVEGNHILPCNYIYKWIQN